MSTVSFRRSLLTNLIAVVLLLGVAIVVMMAFSARRAVESLSESLIRQTALRTQARLRALFEPVERQATGLREWGEAGLLDLDDPEALRALLSPVLEEFEWTSGITIADSRGRGYLLQLHDGAWWERRTRRDEWGDLQRDRRWTDAVEEVVETDESAAYDPRERPWFTGAVALRETSGDNVDDPERLFWSEPYEFFSTGEPGITAAAAYPCGEGLDCVVALDMTLREITRFTGGIRILDQGTVFVLDDLGRFLGVPRGRPGSDWQERVDEFLLKRPDEVAAPAARRAADSLHADPATWSRPLRLVSDGRPWWMYASPFELGPARRLLIGVAVPEEDILGSLGRQRLWVAAITLAVLALAVWRAVALARGFSRPVEALVEESERISTGDLEPGPPIETRVAEIGRLAEAHDKMRGGLQTLLKLERDLQVARQIQQQTFPAKLPEIEGFDLAAWNQPADETGGDTYDVIGLRRKAAGGGFELSQGEVERAMLLLADATGHGIGPALSATQLRAMLRMALRMTDDLAGLAGQINEQLCADLPQGRFLTAWIGLLDGEASTLTTFSAGQAPLVFYRAAEDRFEALAPNAVPFGLFPGMTEAHTGPLELRSGDLYAVISDGIFEAENPAEEEFGLARVEELIRVHHAAPAAEILDRVRSAAEEFTSGAPPNDDRTIVLIKRI